MVRGCLNHTGVNTGANAVHGYAPHPSPSTATPAGSKQPSLNEPQDDEGEGKNKDERPKPPLAQTPTQACDSPKNPRCTKRGCHGKEEHED